MAALEAWQWPEERKMAACDMDVTNDKDLQHLEEKATRFIRQLYLHLEKKRQQQANFFASLWVER